MGRYCGLSERALDPGSDVLAETSVWHQSSDAFWGVLGLQVPLGVRSTGWDRSQGGGGLDSHAQQRFQPHPPKVSSAPQIPVMSSGPPCRAYTGRQVAVGGALERKHSTGNRRSRLDHKQYAPLDRNDTRADFETSPMQTSPPRGPALHRAILIRPKKGSVIRRREPAAFAPIRCNGESQIGSRSRSASRTLGS